VDSVRHPLLGKSCSTGNRTRTSGSVARNSDHYTTDLIGFRTRDLPACSIVPQSLRYCVPQTQAILNEMFVLFLSPSAQTLIQHLKTGHYRSLNVVLIHNSPLTLSSYAVKNAVTKEHQSINQSLLFVHNHTPINYLPTK
jgi:hypothetical protein